MSTTQNACDDANAFTPEGRIQQVDYAGEAVKKGSVTVGIKSKTHAVLVALKPATSALCVPEKTVCQVDTQTGVAYSGLSADGRVLANAMQSECADWRSKYQTAASVKVLSERLQSKMSKKTQEYGSRPYGVGVLLAGYDGNGAHIVKADHSAEVAEAKAASLGSGSQLADAYLEQNAAKFENSTMDELIGYALLAVRETLPGDKQLLANDVTIAVVGKEENFKIMDGDAVAPYLVPLGAAQAAPAEQ